MDKIKKRTRAHESSKAIERLYISMRHLFSRGFYKPMGVSGEALRESLLLLRPEIYGSIAEERTELNGLIYVIERLPRGIEECQFISLTADEGYSQSNFETIIPKKRRRNCYRLDKDQMSIEVTRGRSEIYDILTHLTFLYIESHKIADRVLINKGTDTIREWKKLREIVLNCQKLSDDECDIMLAHLASILGRTFQEAKEAYVAFSEEDSPNRFFEIIFWLGHLAIAEKNDSQRRIITFSSILRENIGHHIYGEIWANHIKEQLYKRDLLKRPLHIISANMHSVMNSLYAPYVLEKLDDNDKIPLYEMLSKDENVAYRKKVKEFAKANGLLFIEDASGTNIDVQIIDTDQVDFAKVPYTLDASISQEEKPVIIVMDYAFGEQAYETMDELLRPYKRGEDRHYLNIQSISIMGKAGILEGGKGDIMIPSAHIFEGTADNYPFKNKLKKSHFKDCGVNSYSGTMISVLGTSLQNKDILSFFHKSSWKVIGLEMEGAHYQKAIQAASKIRGNISKKVAVRYAYYASDNPLETGSTLASGGLGSTGVLPTYVITEKILEQIFDQE